MDESDENIAFEAEKVSHLFARLRGDTKLRRIIQKEDKIQLPSLMAQFGGHPDLASKKDFVEYVQNLIKLTIIQKSIRNTSELL